MTLSVDHEHPYDILAMNGASAALMISEVPLPTPVGAVRIGKVDGNFVVNPNEEDLLGNTDLDLVVAGTEEAILMVEAGAQRDPRGRDPRRARHRPRRDQEVCAAAARAAPRRPARRSWQSRPRRSTRACSSRSREPRRAARRGHAGPRQARAPGRHQGRRGGRARPVLGRSRAADTYAEFRQNARSSRSTSSRSRSSASASPSHKKRPDGRGERRDPPDLDRGRRRCRARTAPRSSRAARRRRCRSPRSAR